MAVLVLAAVTDRRLGHLAEPIAPTIRRRVPPTPKRRQRQRRIEMSGSRGSVCPEWRGDKARLNVVKSKVATYEDAFENLHIGG